MSTVIAIDGPAGSGKSTIARALAERLAIPHVDTGAYYRAATLAVLRADEDPTDEAAVLAVLARSHVERKDDRTLLNGSDVEDAIRTAAVDADVSAIAAHPRVRAHLVELQRAAAGARGAVVEGRDAATVVVPDATLKVWLTAPAPVRAARRAAQQGTADAAQISQIGDRLASRDQADRDNTYRAGDAVEIDTGDLGIVAVVDRVVALLHRHG
ncbi:MAG TPA: (d)CMP kinase [Euzebyales bacterium]|nr:(d)CMP kinase [Euzebyales bacterium]